MARLTPRNFRSAETWAKVKAAYLAGETATAVCERFDVGLANLRRRAAVGGWTRADAALREPAEPAPLLPMPAIAAPTYRISPQQALVEQHGMDRHAVTLTTWDTAVAPAKAGAL